LEETGENGRAISASFFLTMPGFFTFVQDLDQKI
jgi:hypothetical protein